MVWIDYFTFRRAVMRNAGGRWTQTTIDHDQTRLNDRKSHSGNALIGTIREINEQQQQRALTINRITISMRAHAVGTIAVIIIQLGLKFERKMFVTYSIELNNRSIKNIYKFCDWISWILKRQFICSVEKTVCQYFKAIVLYANSG